MSKKLQYKIAMFCQVTWAFFDHQYLTPEFLLLMLILNIMIDTEVEE